MFVHFITATLPGAELQAADHASLAGLLAALPGLSRALIHTPSTTSDPYLNDGPPPALVVETYFPTIATLEAACQGRLTALPAALPGLAGAQFTEQAMAVRAFPTPDQAIRQQPHCSYLVAYEGPAENLPLWHAHYIASHPPIMAKFPAIRQIEIASRVDWCSNLPFPRADFMQRNKVVFDSPEALTAALNSPVRHEMRADFKNFPPFSGGNTHYPMRTHEVPIAR